MLTVGKWLGKASQKVEPAVFSEFGQTPLYPLFVILPGTALTANSTTAQYPDHLAEEHLIRITAAQQQPHPTAVAQHYRPNLQQFEPDRVHLRLRQLSASQRQRPQPFHQHIRTLRQQQPKLIGHQSAQLVRSANNLNCCSLIRFSISPRLQYGSSVKSKSRINPVGG